MGDSLTLLYYCSVEVHFVVRIPIFTYNPTETVIIIVNIPLEVSEAAGYFPMDTILDVLAV